VGLGSNWDKCGFIAEEHPSVSSQRAGRLIARSKNFEEAPLPFSPYEATLSFAAP